MAHGSPLQDENFSGETGDLLRRPERTRDLVSVVIPAYNHARFVSEAVSSVLCQTYPLREIIVVDDGSQDNTREIVAGFGDQVQYIWQENRGLSAARNTGIRASHGEYIGVLDADDRYEPEFLERMVTSLKADPQAGGCYCGFQFVDSRGDPLPQSGTRAVEGGEFYQSLLDGNFLVPECILVRAECYRQVGLFDEALRACEDWDMWLRISRGYRITGTRELLIRHRVLAGSMSSDPLRMLTNRLAVLEKVFGKQPDETAAPDTSRQRAFGRAYLATLYEYLPYGDPQRAYECLRKAVAYCPDLLEELDLYYELGCGMQPKGTRGDFATLNIQESAGFLFLFLDRLFNDPDLIASIGQYRYLAYANANLALGLLSYGSRQLSLARFYLLRSLRWQPGLVTRKQVALALIKSLFGVRMISWFHHALHQA